MQANDNKFEDDELDESTSFEGDELDESTSFEGDELDDSTSFEDDELDDVLPDEGGEPQDSRPEDGAADNQAQGQVIVVETAPGWKKKIIFPTLAGLCLLTLGATLYGTVFTPEKNAAPGAAPGAAPVVMQTDASLDFDFFVMPCHQENSHYVSFSISFKAVEKGVLAELRQKREIVRGSIYDLLKAHAARQTSTLSPGVIKEIVADSVNEWLSAGSVDGVYITNFIVI